MDRLNFHQLLEEYYAVFMKTNGLYSAFSKKQGLSYHALFILYAIYHSKSGCTPKEICDKWLIPKQTVNSVLRTFDKQGFVRYETCQNDKRNKKVSLSKEGRAYAQPLLNALYALEASALEQMGEPNVRQLIGCNQLFLEKMSEEFQKHED